MPSMFSKRPTPPNWKILLYTLLALLILCGLGWFNTNVLGDHTQYDKTGTPISSSVSGDAASADSAQ